VEGYGKAIGLARSTLVAKPSVLNIKCFKSAIAIGSYLYVGSKSRLDKLQITSAGYIQKETYETTKKLTHLLQYDDNLIVVSQNFGLVKLVRTSDLKEVCSYNYNDNPEINCTIKTTRTNEIGLLTYHGLFFAKITHSSVVSNKFEKFDGEEFMTVCKSKKNSYNFEPLSESYLGGFDIISAIEYQNDKLVVCVR